MTDLSDLSRNLLRALVMTEARIQAEHHPRTPPRLSAPSVLASLLPLCYGVHTSWLVGLSGRNGQGYRGILEWDNRMGGPSLSGLGAGPGLDRPRGGAKGARSTSPSSLLLSAAPLPVVREARFVLGSCLASGVSWSGFPPHFITAPRKPHLTLRRNGSLPAKSSHAAHLDVLCLACLSPKNPMHDFPVLTRTRTRSTRSGFEQGSELKILGECGTRVSYPNQWYGNPGHCYLVLLTGQGV